MERSARPSRCKAGKLPAIVLAVASINLLETLPGNFVANCLARLSPLSMERSARPSRCKAGKLPAIVLALVSINLLETLPGNFVANCLAWLNPALMERSACPILANAGKVFAIPSAIRPVRPLISEVLPTLGYTSIYGGGRLAG